MRRIAVLLAISVAAALVLTPGVAFGNFAIHGGYTSDTDSCAGCHRAHTSVSGVTWQSTDVNTGATTDHSALLISNADEIYQFCYACHGNDAQGADTNVEGGRYKGSLYGMHDGQLNGGFAGDTDTSGSVQTSKHYINKGWIAYGGGEYGQGALGATGQDANHFTVGGGNTISMTCASCHDPHGSSNYRLLADTVNGNPVGGYDGSDNPTPFVISNEPGYPNGSGGTQVGWLKHQAGHDQMVAYTPNYTRTMYAKAPGNDVTKGMSGWCAGCHSVYMQTGSPHGPVSNYDAADGWGMQSRHRHPMNVDLTAGNGPTKTLAATITPETMPLPLAHDPGSDPSQNTVTDWLDCMTCHVAHGTSVTMTGWADVADAQNPVPNSTTNGKHGVQPTGDSALLRMNNRGVCEACHNK